MTLCIVSPHLDDAVLSCGVLIQRAAAKGSSVIIANIFSAGHNGENRRHEERDVAKTIGATPFFLNELDAPDRDPRYQSGDEIFFGAFEDVPPDYIAHVAMRLKDFFEAHDVEKVYAPLGAGNHIDHRIAHAAVRKITDLRPVSYYEDRPYILWQGILQGRMNMLGCETGLPEITVTEMTEALGRYHYHRKLPKGAFEQGSLDHYLKWLTPPAEKQVVGKITKEIEATDTELEKLYDALSRYHSQMDKIYGDYETFLSDSFAAERARSGHRAYIERYWALK